MHDELERQIRTYLPFAGDTLQAYVDPLHDLLGGLPDHVSAGGEGCYRFVLVATSALLPTLDEVGRITVRGKAGWTDMHDELPTYRDAVDVPGPVYLLADVGTGPETLNVCPDDALPMVRAAGRTPLTLDEGVAVVRQFPSVLRDHNAFQALATRSPVAPYTKRVPSLWVSKGAPRLGWCWAGNPHTWLGAASAAARLAPDRVVEVADAG
jgi:hypothetical protein